MIPGTIEKSIPFRFIISTAANLPCMACPVCGGDAIHIADAQVLMGKTRVHCFDDDAEIVRSTKDPARRGSAIIVRFSGECGHRFSYAFQFHKGTTFIDLNEVSEFCPSESPSELWRD